MNSRLNGTFTDLMQQNGMNGIKHGVLKRKTLEMSPFEEHVLSRTRTYALHLTTLKTD
jgi:hypothetical protein